MNASTEKSEETRAEVETLLAIELPTLFYRHKGRFCFRVDGLKIVGCGDTLESAHLALESERRRLIQRHLDTRSRKDVEQLLLACQKTAPGPLPKLGWFVTKLVVATLVIVITLTGVTLVGGGVLAQTSLFANVVATTLSNGLQRTVERLERLEPETKAAAKDRIRSMVQRTAPNLAPLLGEFKPLFVAEPPPIPTAAAPLPPAIESPVALVNTPVAAIEPPVAPVEVSTPAAPAQLP